MPALIDPAIAGAVARRLSGEGDRGAPRSPALLDLESHLEVAVARSEELVAQYSGIPAPSPVRWAMVSRGDWAEVNINGMLTLISPLAQKLEGKLSAAPLPVRLLQKGLLSTEVGAMLGYVSRRVLGQYDLIVAETDDQDIPRWKRNKMPGGGASLLFVGTNMVETQDRLGFVPADFALWVAVHEVTHRFQFAGVPWLRDRFFGLIHSYLGSVEMDAKSFGNRVATGARKLVSGSIPAEERNPVYLFATEEQRVILDEIQALMSVVEGHGNFVMDTAGAKVIPSFQRMRHQFDRRREQQTWVQRVVNQVIGLDMKLRQYAIGQRFCEAVVAHGGPGALAHLWADPSHLPSLEELRSPDRWVARVA
jgi:coenzyme F420 biosynthesis associated uncharacterized protein